LHQNHGTGRDATYSFQDPTLTMNSPEQSAELMSAFLDAELDGEEAEAFDSMLAQSPELKSELEDLRRVMQLVSTLGEVEAPPDFADKVTRRLRRHQLLAPDSALMGLISLPFQVLSIIIILAAAGMYMMAQLDRQPDKIERDSPTSRTPVDEPELPGEPPLRPISR
jgi:anti-sigma factor RsiW